MNNIVKIKETEILIKEYKGQRVVTSWDIARVHCKENKRVNEVFRNNQNRFVLEEDYFLLTTKEFSESFKTVQEFIPNNVKEIPLFTESGYMLLTKVFTDDLSWEVQRLLVKSYFTLKQLQEIGSKERLLLNIMLSNNDIEKASAINEYETKYVKPLEKKGEYVDNVLNSESLLTTTIIGKDFGLSAKKLNEILSQGKIIYKQSGTWVLYSKYQDLGLAQTVTTEKTTKEGVQLTFHTLKWTEKGKQFIYNYLKKLGYKLAVEV